MSEKRRKKRERMMKLMKRYIKAKNFLPENAEVELRTFFFFIYRSCEFSSSHSTYLSRKSWNFLRKVALGNRY